MDNGMFALINAKAAARQEAEALAAAAARQHRRTQTAARCRISNRAKNAAFRRYTQLVALDGVLVGVIIASVAITLGVVWLG